MLRKTTFLNQSLLLREEEEVVLPESVKKIGDYAFSEIAALKEINLPDSITEIGTEAFASAAD